MPKAKNEQLELAELIEDSIETFSQMPNSIVEFIKPSFSTNINADRDQILRVFNNLVKNAVQSIPEEREGEVVISIQEGGGVFLIEVSDNGEGVNKEIEDKIFVPNFTTKSKGMGLGLAMVKNIIEEAGGEISFITKIQQGTTFFLTIPKDIN